MAVFYNQATLTYNNTQVNSNIVSGEIVQVITAQKNALTETYTPSDVITYAVSITNSGATAFTNLTVTDDLGRFTLGELTLTPLDYVEGSLRLFIDGVLSQTPTVTAADALVISGINVPAGSNALLIYQARINSVAPLDTGATITNTATVSGGGLSAPVSDSATVSVSTDAILGISKSLSPTVVAENEPLTYTFVVQNTGNTAATATDNVTITDTFDPILSNITVTLDGVALTEGVDYTYDAVTGVFSTTPSRITVPAATFTTDPVTGQTVITPGVAVLRVTGTV